MLTHGLPSFRCRCCCLAADKPSCPVTTPTRKTHRKTPGASKMAPWAAPVGPAEPAALAVRLPRTERVWEVLLPSVPLCHIAIGAMVTRSTTKRVAPSVTFAPTARTPAIPRPAAVRKAAPPNQHCGADDLCWDADCGKMICGESIGGSVQTCECSWSCSDGNSYQFFCEASASGISCNCFINGSNVAGCGTGGSGGGLPDDLCSVGESCCAFPQ